MEAGNATVTTLELQQGWGAHRVGKVRTHTRCLGWLGKGRVEFGGSMGRAACLPATAMPVGKPQAGQGAYNGVRQAHLRANQMPTMSPSWTLLMRTSHCEQESGR